MRRNTTELYGIVDSDILESRDRIAKYFKKKAKKRITELQEVNFQDRDDFLLNDCLKAVSFWNDLLNEEIK